MSLSIERNNNERSNIMDFQGKVAIVTGAASGIGKSISELFVSKGMKVVLTDYNKINLEKTADEIKKKYEKNILSFKMDVRKYNEIENVVDSTLDKFLKIDILINVAGAISLKKVVDMSEEEWDKIVDTNLKGIFLCSKAVSKILIKQNNGGKIVNIASLNGKEGEALTAHYCASKHGVIGFTRSLALELAPHKINVNAVCPGYVNTPMQESLIVPEAKLKGTTPEEIRKFYAKKIPLGRLEEPEDVAKVVLFLVSSDTDYMTGQSINISGGAIMH